MVALSVILIGSGVAAYYFGPQLLPQIFTTSARHIAISAGLAGIGLLLETGLVISICMKKCLQQEEAKLIFPLRKACTLFIAAEFKVENFYSRIS
ncbi:MAG: hypothetical protein JJU12_03020 [Chlamydiales bacterium]|nr:hypothetical protein [Chlamydiales bacterium]